MALNNRIKILSLHWGFIPGGVAVYARHIENVGQNSQIQIKSLCINSAAWPFDQISAAHINMNVFNIKGRLDFSWVQKVRAYIKEGSPDLIMTYGFNGAFVAALTTKKLDIPVVSSWHGDYYPSDLSQRIRKPFFDALLKILFRHRVKEIVTVSNYSKKALLEKKIDGRKIAVIHNGIPPEPLNIDHVQSIRKELRIPEDCLLAGTACRLASQKGLEWFLRAIAIVAKKSNTIRFVLWGDGPQKGHLLSLIKDLGISEFIRMPGYRSDIDHCLPALDIFCMSSFAEYFSIALLEAMRAERPIVATDVGGNPEAIKDGVHGLLVPYADPDAMAEAILKLAGDQSLREKMAANAKQRFLDEFTAEKMVEKTAQWIMNCARKHAGRSISIA